MGTDKDEHTLKRIAQLAKCPVDWHSVIRALTLDKQFHLIGGY